MRILFLNFSCKAKHAHPQPSKTDELFSFVVIVLTVWGWIVGFNFKNITGCKLKGIKKPADQFPIVYFTIGAFPKLFGFFLCFFFV